jgi:hypothetical protein
MRYNRAILKRAVSNYIKRLYVKKMVWLSVATILIVVFAFTCTDSSWLQLLAIVPAVAVPAMLVLGYSFRIQESLKRLELLDGGKITFTVTDASFNVDSALGKSEMSWKLFSELWEFPTNYLLLYTNHQFITLPKKQVPSEFIDRIRAKLPTKAGGN